MDGSAERRFGVGGILQGDDIQGEGWRMSVDQPHQDLVGGRKEATILVQEEMPGLWGVSQSIGIKELRI